MMIYRTPSTDSALVFATWVQRRKHPIRNHYNLSDINVLWGLQYKMKGTNLAHVAQMLRDSAIHGTRKLTRRYNVTAFYSLSSHQQSRCVSHRDLGTPVTKRPQSHGQFTLFFQKLDSPLVCCDCLFVVHSTMVLIDLAIAIGIDKCGCAVRDVESGMQAQGRCRVR
ncbi:hypothetical protein BCV70DRAFT_15185 [Testicularia cyperi]|uniref:Uncharacterized protein n=1 Tax=Testicularia cyperi TaxID=1882483 RepID=A0A317XYW6_9BASI|nr:hypothetical protein BCV70DRAFT_15185 [Testicularia cyperi]